MGFLRERCGYKLKSRLRSRLASTAALLCRLAGNVLRRSSWVLGVGIARQGLKGEDVWILF